MASSAKAGLHEVPITILDLNDSETLEVAIVENIQEDLNIVEEAKGYKRLNEEFGYDQDKIAIMMSRSRESHKQYFKVIKSSKRYYCNVRTR